MSVSTQSISVPCRDQRGLRLTAGSRRCTGVREYPAVHRGIQRDHGAEGSQSGFFPLALSLPQHPDEHRSERPVLLAVDQQLGERPRLGVPVELADAVGPLEVGKHQDAEKLGARSGAEGVETLPQSSFELLEVNGVDATVRFPVDRMRG
jgi:hypothetical protein